MRKWGNSIILSFTAEECNVRDLKPGSEVNVELESTGRNFEEDSKKSLLGLIKENQTNSDTQSGAQDIVKEAMQTAAKILPQLMNPEPKVVEYDITEEAQEQPKPLLKENPILLNKPKMADPESSEGEEDSGDVDFDLQSMIDDAPTEIVHKTDNILPVEKEESKPEPKETFKRASDGSWLNQN